MLVCMRHSTELEVWYWGSELLVTCKQTCCSDDMMSMGFSIDN